MTGCQPLAEPRDYANLIAEFPRMPEAFDKSENGPVRKTGPLTKLIGDGDRQINCSRHERFGMNEASAQACRRRSLLGIDPCHETLTAII